LSEQDIKTIFPAFKQMLSLFAVMQNADSEPAPGPAGEDSPPHETMPAVNTQADFVTASAKPVGSGFLRPDTARQETQKDVNEFMLSQAPERDGNFIVIPNVL
jgi:Asp-tRNA(Asn)/Glu-tRNA(Gln) amidotransferase C subunit